MNKYYFLFYVFLQLKYMGVAKIVAVLNFSGYNTGWRGERVTEF